MMKMGVFGGSFDPVHFGHLWIAEAARETLGLDEVRWIPAARSPLKSEQPQAPAMDRVAMVRLALADGDGHVVDDREIRRGSVSYTVDTLAELAEDFPDSQFWLIIGSDSLASFPQWREPERLLQLAHLAVIQRGGDPEIDLSVLQGLTTSERVDQIRRDIVPMPLIELSSSEMRERIVAESSIRFRTPRAVAALINDRRLYRE
ncbi:MAG: nicotinate (nicotinamide) nucleotide adenylyltransferase [Planctomycetota bacterium]